VDRLGLTALGQPGCYNLLTDLDHQVIAHCRHLDDLTRAARAHLVREGPLVPHLPES
jgi:hypothetical protein